MEIGHADLPRHGGSRGNSREKADDMLLLRRCLLFRAGACGGLGESLPPELALLSSSATYPSFRSNVDLSCLATRTPHVPSISILKCSYFDV
jgi:hypothetical protein